MTAASPPKPADKAAVARTMYLKYTDYAAKWDQIESIFARQSVLKGSFDKYVASSKKRGTAEVCRHLVSAPLLAGIERVP